MMAAERTFANLVRRIRAGDDQAAAGLVRLYEPGDRLEIRMRLDDPRLWPAFDSMDLCQSVRSSFVLRAAGREWAEVSAVLGDMPQARRKQQARALDRIVVELAPGRGDDA